MIRNIHAVAIDNEKDDLEAIHKAAIKANINCRAIHYPSDFTEKLNSELRDHHIRLVICDYHLQAHGAMGESSSNNSTIGGVLENLGIQAWSPYVLLLWSIDAGSTELVEGLRNYLETRGDPKYLPCAIIPLAKANYGIPGPQTDEQIEALWKDLQTKILESRGVKLILQWEAELHRAAGRVACNLVETARSSMGGNVKITIDDELDSLLSRIAVAATSSGFAKAHPRNAVVEGVFPLVSDQYQHMQLRDEEKEIWANGLRQAITASKQKPLSSEHAAALNSALHIARDDSVTRPERGTVFEVTKEEVLARFSSADFVAVFGLRGKWPEDAQLRYVQIEGACDAAQRKKGVVPLVLAAEVNAALALNDKGRPESLEITPIFQGGTTGKTPRKLLVNVRYFFTLERSKLDELKPVYRLRESLVAKLAFVWANHSIRPGIVSFSHDEPNEDAASEIEDTFALGGIGLLDKFIRFFSRSSPK
jgi:hypothetical protein